MSLHFESGGLTSIPITTKEWEFAHLLHRSKEAVHVVVRVENAREGHVPRVAHI